MCWCVLMVDGFSSTGSSLPTELRAPGRIRGPGQNAELISSGAASADSQVTWSSAKIGSPPTTPLTLNRIAAAVPAPMLHMSFFSATGAYQTSQLSVMPFDAHAFAYRLGTLSSRSCSGVRAKPSLPNSASPFSIRTCTPVPTGPAFSTHHTHSLALITIQPYSQKAVVQRKGFPARGRSARSTRSRRRPSVPSRGRRGTP
jgi:hypothetical protein